MSEWNDAEGDSLGSWETIADEEFAAIVISAGGLEALAVFASLTDPAGVYGGPRIYTAWGRPGDRAPLVDINDELDHPRVGDLPGELLQRTCRKFVLA